MPAKAKAITTKVAPMMRPRGRFRWISQPPRTLPKQLAKTAAAVRYAAAAPAMPRVSSR